MSEDNDSEKELEQSSADNDGNTLPQKDDTEDEPKPSDDIDEKLSNAYAENESVKNKYLRAVADIENLRKRTIREREDAVHRTRLQLFTDLLPILDSFKLGLLEAEKSDGGIQVVQGFAMAMNQFEETMKDYGLEVIEPTDGEFDPSIHEAISYEESIEHKDGAILKTFRSGYRLKNNLLRPASVILCKNAEEN
tara:strand:- start:170 stop:751 length:582 start_codon:yes stop_codon:yes gene_type:complete